MDPTLPLLTLFLPLACAVALLAFGRRLPRGGDFVGILGMGAAAVLAFVQLLPVLSPDGLAPASRTVHTFAVFDGGRISLTFGVLVDAPGAIMSLIVCALATGVLVYSTWYMHGDPDYPRFFAYMCFFCFAMLGIVYADNLLMVFLFWELVGLGSYLLIGFWYRKAEADGLSPRTAQRKAFVVNRIGDFGFLCGLGIVFHVVSEAIRSDPSLGTNPFSFETLFRAAGRGAFGAVPPVSLFGFDLSGEALLAAAGLGVFMGAVGKSAQFPLHVWLPDAMQGPTPVSSIIHAATMVAAGVFLVGRMHPFLSAVPGALLAIAGVGALTAILAASIAPVQRDLKAVLAYSTISQLGFMMLGLGAGAEGYTAGMSHLFTHAFFKCMLFLGAGAVLHTLHTQDMFQMGGLWRAMPKTFAAMLVGCLAISGMPLFSGFVSKDAILAAVWARVLEGGAHAGCYRALFWTAVAAASLTAFYMFRLLFLTFLGHPRDHERHHHAREAPAAVWVPLFAMAVLSLQFWWTPGWRERALAPKAPVIAAAPAPAPAPLAESLGGHTGGAPAGHAHGRAHEAHGMATACSLGAGIAGIALAFLLYVAKPWLPDLLAALPGLRALWKGAWNLWGIERLYQGLFVRGTEEAAAGIAAFDMEDLDAVAVDGWAVLVRGSSKGTGRFDMGFVDRVLVDWLFGLSFFVAGAFLRLLQSGRVQWYLALSLTILLGLVYFGT